VDEVRGVWGVLWREPPTRCRSKGLGRNHGWVKAPSEIWLETTSAGPTGVFWQRYTDAMKKIGRYRAVFVPWTVQPEYYEEGDFVPFSSPRKKASFPSFEYQELYGSRTGKCSGAARKSRARLHGQIPAGISYRRDRSFRVGRYGRGFIKPALVLRARKRKWTIPTRR
jgi:hypothetical protein